MAFRSYSAYEMNMSARNRLIRNSKANSETGCLEWSLTKTDDGYGQMSFRSRRWTAHRVSYTVFCGEIPAGMSVLHTCDNRACCEPSHLFLGTQDDNMKDCAAKGRIVAPDRVGSKNTAAKIMESDVAEIKGKLASGHVGRSLAYEYGVSEATISNIKRGKNWAHVP